MARPNITPPVLTDKDIDRFCKKIDKADGQGPTGKCWQWTDKITPKSRYGTFIISSHNVPRTLKPNRVSFFIATGKWPTEQVLHSCDWPPCVNPDHLWEGTQLDNIRDRNAKGRQGPHISVTHPERVPRGERHSNAKFTEEEVREIRRQSETMSWWQYAKQKGYNPNTIKQIVSRRNWKHI